MAFPVATLLSPMQPGRAVDSQGGSWRLAGRWPEFVGVALRLVARVECVGRAQLCLALGRAYSVGAKVELVSQCCCWQVRAGWGSLDKLALWAVLAYAMVPPSLAQGSGHLSRAVCPAPELQLFHMESEMKGQRNNIDSDVFCIFFIFPFLLVIIGNGMPRTSSGRASL